MSEIPNSTLSKIYYMANPHGFEPGNLANSGIVGLDVVSGPDGYKISTEVGFYGGGTFAGMTIHVKTDGGILNQDGVLRGAEVGKCALPGLIAFRTEHVEVDELSTLLGEPAPTRIHSRVVEPPPPREALHLPGEPGFALFRELHSKIGQIATRLSAVTNLLGLEPSPVFTFKQGPGGGHYNHEEGTATYSLKDYYGIGISGQNKAEINMLVSRYNYDIPDLPDRRHMLELGMEQTVPLGTEWPKNPQYNRASIHDAVDVWLLANYPKLVGNAIMQVNSSIGIGDIPGIFPAFNDLRKSLTDLHVADSKAE